MATEKVIPITGNDNRHVHAEDNGQVDNDTVHVSKKAGHQVTWSSASKARIEFSSESGSPFEEATFHIPARGSVSSGPGQSDGGGRETLQVLGGGRKRRE